MAMVGTIASDGSTNVTSVSGTARTGIYASDGSFNVVEVPGTAYVGLYHACGAFNVVVVSGSTYVGRYAPCGALNVILTDDNGVTGATYVTVVTGSIGSRAAALISSETNGLAIDFTDLSMVIKDTVTPANAFSGNPNSKLTYTSPSTKWIRNASGLLVSGTTLRTEYDASGNALGIRVEEARTNLCLRSQEFDNAEWAKGNFSLTANAATAPDGTSTAEGFVETASTAARQMYASTLAGALTSSTVYTISMFVKADVRSTFLINLQGSANNYAAAVFDISAANTTASQTSVGSTSGTIVSTRQEAFAGGWYRCSLTASVGSSATPSFSCAPATTGNTFTTTGLISYAGNSSNSVYIWGAQTELGSFATSYIPTVAATVTRTADNPLGTSLASWFGVLPHTIYGTFVPFGKTGVAYVLAALGDGSGTNNEVVFISAGDSGRVNQAANGDVTTSNSYTSLATTKLAGAFNTDDLAVCLNGGTVATDATANVISGMNKLYIGRQYNGTSYLNGHIKSLVVLPRRATNTELQGFTS